jgi:hypothetical protein
MGLSPPGLRPGGLTGPYVRFAFIFGRNGTCGACRTNQSSGPRVRRIPASLGARLQADRAQGRAESSSLHDGAAAKNIVAGGVCIACCALLTVGTSCALGGCSAECQS